MRATRLLGIAIFAGLALFLATSREAVSQTAAVRIDPDDIGGVVTGPKGPEAGVWVIAETTELPARLSKTVVTGSIRWRPTGWYRRFPTRKNVPTLSTHAEAIRGTDWPQDRHGPGQGTRTPSRDFGRDH